jgi:hypothetical protein
LFLSPRSFLLLVFLLLFVPSFSFLYENFKIFNWALRIFQPIFCQAFVKYRACCSLCFTKYYWHFPPSNMAEQCIMYMFKYICRGGNMTIFEYILPDNLYLGLANMFDLTDTNLSKRNFATTYMLPNVYFFACTRCTVQTWGFFHQFFATKPAVIFSFRVRYILI